MTTVFLSDEYLIDEGRDDTPVILNLVKHDITAEVYRPRIDLSRINVVRAGPRGRGNSYPNGKLKDICDKMFGVVPVGGKKALVDFLNDPKQRERIIENNRLLDELDQYEEEIREEATDEEKSDKDIKKKKDKKKKDKKKKDKKKKGKEKKKKKDNKENEREKKKDKRKEKK